MKLKNSTYDKTKFIALVALPAIATFYFAFAGIWNLPHTEQVVGSITAFDAFLGALLHVSTKSYSPVTDGKIVVDKSDPAKDTYSLEVDTPLDELDQKGTITLQVHAAPSIEMKTTKP